VIAYSVGQRTREIGLRMALGVSAERVWRSILWHGIKPAIAGAAVGLLCGFAAAHLTARLLFATSAGDITSYLAAATLVLIVAALATFLPAWRAARIDPARALRHE
jgi:ABC-type antimicrobial peptide transport system permease subunit